MKYDGKNISVLDVEGDDNTPSRKCALLRIFTVDRTWEVLMPGGHVDATVEEIRTLDVQPSAAEIYKRYAPGTLPVVNASKLKELKPGTLIHWFYKGDHTTYSRCEVGAGTILFSNGTRQDCYVYVRPITPAELERATKRATARKLTGISVDESPANGTDADYLFKNNRGSFLIRYAGEDVGTFKHVGFFYIHQLLKERQPIGCMELMQRYASGGAARRLTSETTHVSTTAEQERLRKRLREIGRERAEMEKQEVEDAVDVSSERTKLDAECEQIKRMMNKSTYKGKIRMSNPDAEKARKDVCAAITYARKILSGRGVAGVKLATWIKDHIETGRECFYRHDPETDWTL